VEAMSIYQKHTVTKSVELLQSARKACDKVRAFLENIDLTEEDDKGKPKYQVSTVTSALKNVTDLVPQLQELEKKIEQEVKEQGRAKGANKSMFEDGFDFDNR
jgi:Pyruvate/2-oxoacid:ferredoxin oxidoreductase gamma subunit